MLADANLKLLGRESFGLEIPEVQRRIARCIMINYTFEPSDPSESELFSLGSDLRMI